MRCYSRHMEIAGWLHRLLPKVESYGWGEGCWVAHTKMRTAEHHPPYHWLGRALDAVEAAGVIDRIRAALLKAHGANTCEGWSERDERAQDVLTAACAYAWAGERLGQPLFVEAESSGLLLVRVPSIDAWLAPRRLWPARTMESLLRQLASHAVEAASELGDGRGRILYLDLNLDRGKFARDVGYDGPLTEPLRQGLKHHALERRLGWVLTRPFEWGVPIEAWY